MSVETTLDKKDKKPSTAHLKTVPETRELRDQIRNQAHIYTKSINRADPLTKLALQKQT